MTAESSSGSVTANTTVFGKYNTLRGTALRGALKAYANSNTAFMFVRV